MFRWLKISLTIIGVLLFLLTLFWAGTAYYIHKNNKTVLFKILGQVNQEINGELKVSHMETTLLKGFPGISVSLKNVSLKDSLWLTHRRELLNAKDINVTLNALSLLVGTVNIRKVAINHAKIYLYTDSNGYSNTNLFRKKNKTKKEQDKSGQSNLQIRIIDLNKVNLTIDNRNRFKLFSFYVDALKGKVKYPSGQWHGDFKLNTKIRSFAFNTKKGSFLKNKTLKGNLKAHYNENSEVIVIDQKPLEIGGDTYNIGANINIGREKPAFSIALKADQLLFKNIASILAPNISAKLLKFAIEKPIDVTGTIIDDGSKNNNDPLINVKMVVQKNKVTIPSGQLTDCNFIGFFSNQDTTSRPIGDANSIIRFYDLKANYYNVPIRVDTFTVTNLLKPIAQGLVTAKFELKKLNNAFEENLFSFDKGVADLRLYCKADIENFLFTKPVVNGKIQVKDADITYLPRKLKFVNTVFNLNFNQKDLNITDSKFQLGRSILDMNCSVANFLNLYYTDPAKILVKANLSSPHLQLSEFLPLLSPKETKPAVSTQKALKSASSELNNVLDAAQLDLQVRVKKAVYNRFVANNLNANIAMRGNSVLFNKIDVQHAGGKVTFNGKITQLATVNKMSFSANIHHVSIKEFFYAFDNFGQQSITSKNLNGFLSARVNAQGDVTAKGNMVPKSIYGNVNFTLDKAALIGFEPIENVGKFIFRSRNLSHVKLEKLNGALKLRGDKVDISPMKVNSTAINFDIKGIYAFNEGTHIELDVPLRDPKKSSDIIDKEERDLARMKGIVLHLKAVDEDGKIKIKWNGNRDK